LGHWADVAADQARNRSTLAGLSRALGFPEDHLWRVAMEGLNAAGPADDETGRLTRAVADLQRRVAAIELLLRVNQGVHGGEP
jgi:hypothetical protein